MTSICIAFTGRPGCGKDTAADYLLGLLVVMYPDLVIKRAALATGLKDQVHKFLSLVVNEQPDPITEKDLMVDYGSYTIHLRKLYQEFGSAMVDVYDGIWVDYMVKQAGEVNILIVSDIRLEHEITHLKKYFKLYTVKLIGREREGVREHHTNAGLNNCTFTIDNSDSIEHLHDQIACLSQTLSNGGYIDNDIS